MFALDCNSDWVAIQDAIKGVEYHCPHCGGILIPKQGNERCWHFSHKSITTKDCSYESYLHKLAKKKISDYFNNSQSFKITLKSQKICSADCPVGLSAHCHWPIDITFDLKQYYNICNEEVSIGDFRADLLISNSTNPNIDPILIEIYVNHKSTDEKLKSKYRIIEIKIESESDIEDIVSAQSLDENSNQIQFYNFTPQKEYGLPNKAQQQPKFLFWIDSKKYFYLNKIEDYDENVRCLSSLPKEIENSIFRIESPTPIAWDFAFYQLLKSGIDLKYCTMCRYYRWNEYHVHSICILYKSKGTPEIPMLSVARKCKYFNQIDYRHDNNRLFVVDLDNPNCKIHYKKSSISTKTETPD